ncbi:hypothetical protein [Xylella fastidiosa]|uniref:hypothetical protein n=1 Tax=Xylella fastidiosa TaxID=2371 RepID=UPI000A50ADAB|nr:hypothetical protein [Xylella fastidiosa]
MFQQHPIARPVAVVSAAVLLAGGQLLEARRSEQRKRSICRKSHLQTGRSVSVPQHRC